MKQYHEWNFVGYSWIEHIQPYKCTEEWEIYRCLNCDTEITERPGWRTNRSIMNEIQCDEIIMRKILK